jgi:hypothetical protein
VEAIELINGLAKAQVTESSTFRNLNSFDLHREVQGQKPGPHPLPSRDFAPSRDVLIDRSEGRGIRNYVKTPEPEGFRRGVLPQGLISSVTYTCLKDILATDTKGGLDTGWEVHPVLSVPLAPEADKQVIHGTSDCERPFVPGGTHRRALSLLRRAREIEAMLPLTCRPRFIVFPNAIWSYARACSHSLTNRVRWWRSGKRIARACTLSTTATPLALWTAPARATPPPSPSRPPLRKFSAYPSSGVRPQ